MHSDKIFGIKNRILILIIITCFIPFIILSVYAYIIFSNYIEESTINSSLRNVEKSDKLIFSDMWLIEYAAKRMCADDNFKAMFIDNSEQEKYSKYMKNALNGIYMVEGVVAFDSDGNCYEYGVCPEKYDRVNLMFESSRTSMSHDKLNWSTKPNGKIMAGIFVDGGGETGQDSILAHIFFFVKDDIFANLPQNYGDGNMLMCDEYGNIIVSNSEYFHLGENVWNCSIELNDFMYDDTNQATYLDFNGENYICIRYKSQFVGWYYLQIVKSSVFLKNARMMTRVSITIVSCVLIIIFMIYFFVIKRLFKPIVTIDNAMRNVVSNDFNTTLEINTRDEFSVIAKGFNYMVEEIQKLLDDMKKSNDEKMHIEIQALQYQINPHFLYNVLAAVRFMALKTGQEEIGDLLLKLSRLFKAKLKDSGNDVTVSEDIETMNDYIDLMNLRYDNKIDVVFDVDDKASGIKIPPLLLQPLIENAITHGVAPKLLSGEQLIIQIEIKVECEALVISVYDNGMGMSQEKTHRLLFDDNNCEGVGFRNVKKRLEYRYGEKLNISINSKQGEFTKVIITIHN